MRGRPAWLWCLRTLALAVPAPHAPAALADDEALQLSATAPAAAWELGPTAQVKWTCGAGQRNADASECLAAVVAATRGAANGHIKLTNSEGMPPGCSYSLVSGAAMFNAGAGQVGSDKENYQLVCSCSYSQNSKMAVLNRNTAHRSLSSTHYQPDCVTSAPTRMIVLSRGRGGSSVLAKTLAVFAKSNPKWLHHGARKTRTLATRPPE